jgi:hypothetical protein
LLRLVLLWCLHVPLGWFYLYGAVLRLPVVGQAAGRKPNPFTGPREKKSRGGTKQNPFTDSKDSKAKAG